MRLDEMMIRAVLAAESEMSNSDIILRTLIGMVFIMSMMCLAAVLTGVIGRWRAGSKAQQDALPEDETADPEADQELPAQDEAQD